MKKNKHFGFALKALNLMMVVSFSGYSSVSFAQAKPQSPIDQAAPAVTQATNPFGSVKAPSANETKVEPQINYSGQNNLNGDKQILLPMNDKLVNPAVAAQQQGVISSPPVGLPQQEYNPRSGMGQIDPLELQMNILNTPDKRIREMNRDIYQKGRVINDTPYTTPKTNNGVVVAHISPGSTSPVVRVSRNRTSTIIITDSSGQPWPIINYDGLSDEDFTVKRLDNPAPDGYVLSITPKGSFVSGNLVLILKGLPTPLNVEFVSAQKDVDVSTEIRVQAKGPNTQFASLNMPNGIDTALLSILQGVAPQGAKELKVSTPAVQAWLAKDGSMYVRTRYKVMSPAFENVTSSPDGTYAYKMVPVPVVLYKVSDGRFGEFAVDGF